MQLQAIVLLCHENIPQGGGELRGDLEDNSLLLVILLLVI